MNLNGYSVDKVREHNLKLIIHYLYKNGPLSCKELAKLIDLSETAIKKNIVQLIENNAVIEHEEVEEKKAVGRQHIRYEMNKDYGNFLLVDFTYNSDYFCITDTLGNELYNERIDVPQHIEKNDINAVIKKILNVVNENKYNIKEVAISAPGQVNEETGDINFSSRLDKYRISNISIFFKEAFPNAKIIVRNDLRFLVCGDPDLMKKSQNTIASYFLIGYGIMSAFVKDGKILQGLNGISGEIGCVERNNGKTYHELCSIPCLIDEVNKIKPCSNFEELVKLYISDSQVRDLVLSTAEIASYDIDVITAALGSNEITIVGDVADFGELYISTIQSRLGRMPYFPRKVSFLDQKIYRKIGMVEVLKGCLIDTIK